MKACFACKTQKQPTEFSKNKRHSDGLQQRCKDCYKQYREEQKKKNSLIDRSEIKELNCTKCNTIKSIINFSLQPNKPRGFDYWCKDCRNSYKRDYYSENIEDRRHYTNNKRQERIQWFWSIKQGKECMDCHNVYDPFCMDFDHLGEKINAVSRMVLENSSKEDILKEIEKCELVCVLCHNIRTQKRLDEKFKNKKSSPYILRNIEIINNTKNKACFVCGKVRELCNMQFDHISSNDKYKNVSQLKSFAVDTLLMEIKKCRVICALCHRRKSILEQKQDIYPENRVKITINKKTPTVDDGLVWCSRCEIAKEIFFFVKRYDTKTGFNAWCKDCLNAYKREKRKNIKTN